MQRIYNPFKLMTVVDEGNHPAQRPRARSRANSGASREDRVANVITRESALAALQAHDWITAQTYWAQLAQRDIPAASEWLSAIEAEAKPVAESGEKYAQSVLGFVGVMRYSRDPLTATEDLRTALRWLMAAARHEGAELMIHQVLHWYRYGNSHGFQDADVDAFLAEPEILMRYRQHRG